jgi:hypothetical protein
MHWITLGIIALSLIISARFYPRFAFATLAVLIAGAVALLLFNPGERERSGALVGVDAVEIGSISAMPGYGGSFDVSGRAKNVSQEVTVTELTLRLSILDCTAEDPSVKGQREACAEMGSVVRRVATAIKPGESRDFQVNVSFPQAKRRGEIRWKTALQGVHGKVDR